MRIRVNRLELRIARPQDGPRAQEVAQALMRALERGVAGPARGTAGESPDPGNDGGRAA
ncbi:MAG TPA: hypothetical protein VF188_01465 [Longimicrobiales bacterium]